MLEPLNFKVFSERFTYTGAFSRAREELIIVFTRSDFYIPNNSKITNLYTIQHIDHIISTGTWAKLLIVYILALSCAISHISQNIGQSMYPLYWDIQMTGLICQDMRHILYQVMDRHMNVSRLLQIPRNVYELVLVLLLCYLLLTSLVSLFLSHFQV